MVHTAAFTMPEFARSIIEDNKNVFPAFGHADKANPRANSAKKKALRLGSEIVVQPAVEYIMCELGNQLTVGECLPTSTMILTHMIPC